MWHRCLALAMGVLLCGSLAAVYPSGVARAADPIAAGTTTSFPIPDGIRDDYLSPTNCLPDCNISPDPGDEFATWGMYLVAGVPVAFSATKLARATLYKDFTYTGAGPVWGRVSGTASWGGELFLLTGVGEREAGVEIVLSVVDLDTSATTQQVLHRSVCSSDPLDITGVWPCLENDTGAAAADLRFPLEPGHDYELRYTASVWGKVAGVGASATSNFYGNTVQPILPGVFLDDVVHAVDKDLQGQIDELNEQVDELTETVASLTRDLAALRASYRVHTHIYKTGPSTAQNSIPVKTSTPR